MAKGGKRGHKAAPRTRRKTLARRKPGAPSLKQQLAEALARQAATAGILSAMSGSMTDAKPVFDAIVEHCHTLFKDSGVALRLLRDGVLHLQANIGLDTGPLPVDRASAIGACVLDARTVHLPDIEAATAQYPRIRQLGLKFGYRSGLYAPLLHGGNVIGTIAVLRPTAGAFGDKDVALLNTFADQAVIAIENVRLFNETKEALERQTATAEILRVIASSPSDVQPVFDAIAGTARRLLGGFSTTVTRIVDDTVHLAAFTGVGASGVSALKGLFPAPLRDRPEIARAAETRAPFAIVDSETHSDVTAEWREMARKRGFRSVLFVPMLREGVAIGTINVTRSEPGVFGDHQVNLLKTFADQAVIAIENVRLFNETKEALERQTATAEILRVISQSPTDVQPVFESIVHSGARLFHPCSAGIVLREGQMIHFRTAAGPNVDANVLAALHKVYPHAFDPETSIAARVMEERRLLACSDTQAEGAPDVARRAGAAGRYRSVVCVPLVRGEEGIGAIGITYPEPGYELSAKQVELLRTFADQAVIAIENVRLFNETKEALERQTATAEILTVIARSPSDTQPVFGAILDAVKRLFDGFDATVWGVDADYVVAVARGGPTLGRTLGQKVPLSKDYVHGLVILERRPVRSDDVATDQDITEISRKDLLSRGRRAILMVPLVREGRGVGSISVSRAQPFAFTSKHVTLLQTFADQAVIAIENARLFNETKEALERQTATAEILKVIAGSPSDVQPVFDAIARSASRLCDASFSIVFRFDGTMISVAADDAGLPDALQVIRSAYPAPPGKQSIAARAILERKVISLADAQDVLAHPQQAERARAIGYHSILAVPMMKGDAAIGSINAARFEVRPFTEAQAELLKTFADQAVIAIENVRLFNETKEALERQTATAEILKVIAGSPTDVQPVFDVIVQSAVRLCGARFGRVYRYDGSVIQMVASHGLSAKGLGQVRQVFPRPASDDTIAGQVILTRLPFFVRDIEREESVPALSRKMIEALGTRSQLTVPMLRGGEPIGAITMGWEAPGAFGDQQLALLQTFADQAVIAVENVRLFNETSEALERQTATAGILRVISGSPSNVQPVFETILNHALQLCQANFGYVCTSDGTAFDIAAQQGLEGEVLAAATAAFRETRIAGPTTALGRLRAQKRPIHIMDAKAEPAYRTRDPRRVAIVELAGARTMLAVPLLRDEAIIGAAIIYRREVRPFTDKQIALLQTFADQAVIAIENVRLFKELQQRTEALTQSVGQLTALGEVGQAISSTLDLETVLQTIVTRAVQLTGMDAGSIYEYDEAAEVYSQQAAENMAPDLLEAVRRTPIRKGEGAIGRSALTLEPVQAPDILDDSYQSVRKEMLVRAGYRAVLAVPLLREDRLLGALQVFRSTPGPFVPEVVELLQTFATQSAMAIQNARLFREIAEKGRQLEQASRHKSDFLASMSHELRTPLNAILGFNEMILGQIYGEVPRDMQEPLQDIQSSGKHLLRLINNVLDLAKIEAGRMELALADYSVHDTVASVHSTLRPLAADKGLEFLASVPNDLPLAHGDGGRISQCLMNLAGNALKFTKAGKVEISVALNGSGLRYCVADTGIGIPEDKIGGLFTEFKQTDATIANEYGGTGLGLSISRKFVEMHGGRIWVESEPGKGSSFIFEVPLRVGGEASA